MKWFSRQEERKPYECLEWDIAFSCIRYYEDYVKGVHHPFSVGKIYKPVKYTIDYKYGIHTQFVIPDDNGKYYEVPEFMVGQNFIVIYKSRSILTDYEQELVDSIREIEKGYYDK